MVTSFGMSEALGLVTIGEKGGEVFLGASLQDLGSVGPETLNLIDNEVERLVGDAEARAGSDPRPQLEHRRGDRHRAARAGDALGRRARRACSRPSQEVTLEELRDVRRATPPRRDPKRDPHADAEHAAPPALAGDGGRADRARALDHRARRRRPPRRRSARSPGTRSAPSRTPAACSLLGKNRKFPAAAIPTVNNAKRVGGKTAEQLAGTLPARDRRPRHAGAWTRAPYPLTKAQTSARTTSSARAKTCEARRRLAAVGLAS